MIREYRGLIAKLYPGHKTRGDGQACMDARRIIQARLLVMSAEQLSLQQVQVCTLAYDACLFIESGPGKGDLDGFLFGVEDLLYPVLTRVYKSVAANILDMIHDIEFEESYKRPPFLPALRAGNDVSLTGCGVVFSSVTGHPAMDDDEDEFERHQQIDESAEGRLGLDKLEED